jgi:hypothetical protein
MRIDGYLLIAGLMLLAACATSRPTPIRQASAAPPLSTDAITPVVTAADDPRTGATNRFARELGYKIETRHGQQFYCRTATPVGSRIPEKQCLTADGVVQAKQIADQNKDNWQESHQCLGAGCYIKDTR